MLKCSNPHEKPVIRQVTLSGSFEEAGDGDVSSVVAVAWIWLSEAVHMKKLPVGHLTVGVEHLFTFMNTTHTNHL